MILLSVLGTLLGPVLGALLAIPAAVVVATLMDQLTAAGNSPRKRLESKEETAPGGGRER